MLLLLVLLPECSEKPRRVCKQQQQQMKEHGHTQTHIKPERAVSPYTRTPGRVEWRHGEGGGGGSSGMSAPVATYVSKCLFFALCRYANAQPLSRLPPVLPLLCSIWNEKEGDQLLPFTRLQTLPPLPFGGPWSFFPFLPSAADLFRLPPNCGV